VVRLAVAAGVHLEAEFVPSPDEVRELKYIKDWDAYLHGVAAALKSSKENGDVKPDGTTGRFHQGYNWAVSKRLQLEVHKDLYRFAYNDLWEALSGNAVWNANAPIWQKNLYQLVVTACKDLKIQQKQLFARSPEQVINAKFTKTWSFQSKAVFSDAEVFFMESRVSKDLEAYNIWLKDVKEHWIDHVDQCLTEYGHYAKALRQYDARIQAIATIRANAIFRSTKRGKKDTVPAGLTREARLEYLSFAAWIQATNPTGLGINDDRIETKLPAQDDESAAEQFLSAYVEIFDKNELTNHELLKPWLVLAVTKAKAIVKAHAS
jgi:hypothetical protein